MTGRQPAKHSAVRVVALGEPARERTLAQRGEAPAARLSAAARAVVL